MPDKRIELCERILTTENTVGCSIYELVCIAENFGRKPADPDRAVKWVNARCPEAHVFCAELQAVLQFAMKLPARSFDRHDSRALRVLIAELNEYFPTPDGKATLYIWRLHRKDTLFNRRWNAAMQAVRMLQAALNAPAPPPRGAITVHTRDGEMVHFVPNGARRNKTRQLQPLEKPKRRTGKPPIAVDSPEWVKRIEFVKSWKQAQARGISFEQHCSNQVPPIRTGTGYKYNDWHRKRLGTLRK